MNMKLKILLLFLSLALLLCACDGATPNTDGHTTEANTVATTAGTGEPYVSQATSLFTLLTNANYEPFDYVFTDDVGNQLYGYTPIEGLPPINEKLINQKMVINPVLEKEQIYFYYCKNEGKQTERLAIIITDGEYGSVMYPLLIVADVNFASSDAFETILKSGVDFEINIVAVAHLCKLEAFGKLDEPEEDDFSMHEGITECFGVAGGKQATRIYPHVKTNRFHAIFDRHSMTEIMGIYVEESDN